ncbi:MULTISPECIES: phage virion morphogenesis protein [unclassified Pseudoalteromonas]|nr:MULTISPECIES: phage virion morphogenesis protein [unclassified Pseudoalteromonas]
MIPRLAAIPARPFLGLSEEDEAEVIEILSEFLI